MGNTQMGIKVEIDTLFNITSIAVWIERVYNIKLGVQHKSNSDIEHATEDRGYISVTLPQIYTSDIGEACINIGLLSIISMKTSSFYSST